MITMLSKSYIRITILSIIFFLSNVCSASDQFELNLGHKKIVLIKGDIVQQPVDAIVNAANQSLVHAGGIAAAISKAAGPQLQQNSTLKIRNNGPVAVASGVVTSAYDLKEKGIQYIVHVVGPDCRDPQQECMKQRLLADAYHAIFALLPSDVHSIALPPLSIGIFAYKPRLQATKIAINTTIMNFLRYPTLTELRFVIFDVDRVKEQEIFAEYKKELLIYGLALQKILKQRI